MLSLRMSGSAPSPFSITAKDGRARVGQLATPHGILNTPTALLYTRRGNALSLVPDTLATLQPALQGVQVDAMQFLKNPDAETLKAYGHGGHAFLGLDGYVMLASNRDPTVYEYGGRPHTKDSEVYITIHSGGHLVKPSTYMDVIEGLQPDIYVTLCDEVGAEASNKRLATSLKRNDTWLDQCLEEQQARGINSLSLAAIGGGASVTDRAKAAQAVAGKPVAGFALCGFGTGEDPASRPTLLCAALDVLPEDKPRFLSGMGSPTEVLDAVAQGVDILDTSYIARVTQAGYALSFPTQPPAADAEPQASLASHTSPPDDGSVTADGAEHLNGSHSSAGTDSMKMNMWSVSFRHDKRPLILGCKCFACQNHTRAYIHHLLQVHEMLAEVLLEIHNTHHYLAFMDAVRQAIQHGKLEEYGMWFKNLKDGAVEAPTLKRKGYGRPEDAVSIRDVTDALESGPSAKAARHE